MSADHASVTSDSFYAERYRATLHDEREFYVLRLHEGSPMPAGSCIHRQQTSFAVQIHFKRGLRLQHCLE